MEFYAHHGCYAEERQVGGRFRVDLSYEVDAERAVASDRIEDTVSYLEVYECIRRQMEPPANLIEHVADRAARAVMARFPAIRSLRITLSKLAPPLGGPVERVAVTLTLP